MEKIYSMHKLVGLQLFGSGTPTFSSGTPTFCQMGVLNSCFQNPSESSEHATKHIPELKEMTYTERLKNLKLPRLAHRRICGDMIQTFKIIKAIEDIPSERFFKLCTSLSTRGHTEHSETRIGTHVFSRGRMIFAKREFGVRMFF